MLPLLASLLVGITSLQALTLQFATGNNDGEEYGVLTLSDPSAFRCTLITEHKVECIIPKSLRNPQNFSNRFGTFSTTNGNPSKVTFSSRLNVRIFGMTHKNSALDNQKRLNESAPRWQIVAYGYHTPFITPEKPSLNTGLSFPIAQTFMPYPAVGSLDSSGEPVKSSGGRGDISSYLEAKRQFEIKAYDKVLTIAEKTLARYPDSLFRAELAYLRMQAMLSLSDTVDTKRRVLTIAQEWVKEYSSDPSLPEVLLIIANINAKVGSRRDAAYYYEQIIDEYAKTPVGYKAILHYGDYLYAMGYQKRGLESYSQVLYETKDPYLASEASYRLGVKTVERKLFTQGLPYFQKIYTANKKFYTEDPAKGYYVFTLFADQKSYEYAIKLGKDLLNILPKKSKEYEETSFRLAELYRLSEQYQLAKESYEHYIKAVPDGKYLKEAKSWKEKLLFATQESPEPEKRLELYEKILKEQDPASENAQIALYRKTKILFDAGRYHEVLELKPKLAKLRSDIAPDKETMIRQSGGKLAVKAMKEMRCEEAFSLAQTYNIPLGSEWDEQKFKCYYGMNQIAKSEEIARNHLKTPNLDEKALWLYREQKTLFKMGKHTEAYRAGSDLYALSAMLKKSDPAYVNVLYDNFESANTLGKLPMMVDTMKLIETRFGPSGNNIGRYNAIIRTAQAQKNSTLALAYAMKIIQWQRTKGVNPESPRIEFLALDLWQKQGNAKEALAMSEAIRKLNNITVGEKARALYASSTHATSLGNKALAKERLKECAALGKAGGTWQGVCQESLAVME